MSFGKNCTWSCGLHGCQNGGGESPSVAVVSFVGEYELPQDSLQRESLKKQKSRRRWLQWRPERAHDLHRHQGKRAEIC